MSIPTSNPTCALQLW